MKVATVILASAIAASASAITPPFDDDYLVAICNEPGQACHQVKRAAEAAAIALANPEPCQGPADACALAKRDTEDFLNVISDVYANYTSPDSEHDVLKRNYRGGIWGYTGCRYRGQGCSKKRAVEPEPELGYRSLEFCRRTGQPCHKMKRAAEAIADALAMPEPDPSLLKWGPWGYFSRCRWRGQACSKKREAEPMPAPEPEPFCRYRGQPCSKKREAEPEPFCRYRGQPCSKKREALPFCRYRGQPCSKARRDLEKLSEFANDFTADIQ